jgi:hypothetical protein
LYDKDMTSSQQNKTFTSIKVLIWTNLLMVWIFLVHERQKLPLMPWSYKCRIPIGFLGCLWQPAIPGTQVVPFGNQWSTRVLHVITWKHLVFHVSERILCGYWHKIHFVLSLLSLISILNLGFVNQVLYQEYSGPWLKPRVKRVLACHSSAWGPCVNHISIWWPVQCRRLMC